MPKPPILPQMRRHSCEALVVTCIDFRFQACVKEWEAENLQEFTYDRVALAGGVFDIYTVLRQIDVSSRLHKINKVVLINHEDCGAYGDTGTPQRHRKDLLEAKHKIKALFPEVAVETYYLRLNGEFQGMPG